MSGFSRTRVNDKFKRINNLFSGEKIKEPFIIVIDDILYLFIFFFFEQIRFDFSCELSLVADNFHKLSGLIFLEKKKCICKNIVCGFCE